MKWHGDDRAPAAPYRRPALLDDLRGRRPRGRYDSRRPGGAALKTRPARRGRPGGRSGPPGPAAPARASPTSPTRSRWRPSSPSSASTPARSPPPSSTTPSRTPGSTSRRWPSEFGPEVAAIVDGVTKLDRLQFDSKEAQQAATIRKMLVAMASDWRVLVIKLADRLHNMRTIAVMPEWKQRRTAQETLDIYAPARAPPRDPGGQVAARGPGLRHPCTPSATPRSSRWSPPGHPSATSTSPGCWSPCESGCAASGVDGRGDRAPEAPLEHLREDGRAAARSSTRSTTSSASGSSSTPKRTAGPRSARSTPSGARCRAVSRTTSTPRSSTSTSRCTRRSIGLEGKPIEVQIRTHEMHRRAEYGIAAHWGYKEQARDGAAAPRPRWPGCSGSSTGRQDTTDPVEFLETLKLDLEQDEVYVFTPKGKVIALPAGSTPIDFAYAIHTEVGHRCIGAKVNGRLVPLDTQLPSADTVEIFTSKVPSAGPSRDWLQIVASPRARNKIRQWFSRERREDAIENGPRGADQGAAPGGPAHCRSWSSSDALERLAAVHELRGPRRAARGRSARATSRRARWSSAWPESCGAAARGAAADDGAPRVCGDAAPAGVTAGRLRRGPRRRDGAAVALLHARCPATRSSASSPEGAA